MFSKKTCSGRDSLRDGFTLANLLIVLVVAGILLGTALPAIESALTSYSLNRSADLARAHLNRARLLAVARRESVKVRLSPEGELLLRDSRDSLLAVTRIQGDGLLRLDSVRIRPASFRFNPRGQAGAGSLYLYRGRKGVRLVSNFLGRLRRETLSLP